MALARVLQVCDDCVASIRDAWGPLDPDGVARVYEQEIDASSLEGRQVLVFPAGFAWFELGTRAGDVHDERVQVLVVERYADAGAVPAEWLDERILFVQDHVLDVLDDPRGEPVTGYWCQTSEVDPAYDLQELVERKLFLALATFTFRANDG